jgi:hypothetical protein
MWMEIKLVGFVMGVKKANFFSDKTITRLQNWQHKR